MLSILGWVFLIASWTVPQIVVKNNDKIRAKVRLTFNVIALACFLSLVIMSVIKHT